ncbi:MAG: hypothetical protein K0U74_17420 [Alphaproteobacteria bacterium]|nr:hypothetical protein [Alphaproteobacteria bacterium]
MKTSALYAGIGAVSALAIVVATAPANAAVDCTKDYDMISGGAESFDLTIDAEVRDGLVGWDIDNDGKISRAEYNEVCNNNPEEYKSIENMNYFKKQQLRGQ